MNTNVSSAGQLLGIPLLPGKNTIVVAIVGCGGKTTFINNLAYEYKHLKVLVTPTTKIRPVEGDDTFLCKTLQECEKHVPIVGIQFLGIQNNTSGKLEALPGELLRKIYTSYDLVLLEADGSRGLPCKGWLTNEPVIPKFVTHTVGIVTMKAIGEFANESHVLRLAEFLSLTNLREGDIITLQTLLDMVCNDGGMFKNSTGKAFLFINQLEGEKDFQLVNTFLETIYEKYPKKFFVLAFGSARVNKWRKVQFK